MEVNPENSSSLRPVSLHIRPSFPREVFHTLFMCFNFAFVSVGGQVGTRLKWLLLVWVVQAQYFVLGKNCSSWQLMILQFISSNKLRIVVGHHRLLWLSSWASVYGLANSDQHILHKFIQGLEIWNAHFPPMQDPGWNAMLHSVSTTSNTCTAFQPVETLSAFIIAFQPGMH